MSNGKKKAVKLNRRKALKYGALGGLSVTGLTNTFGSAIADPETDQCTTPNEVSANCGGQDPGDIVVKSAYDEVGSVSLEVAVARRVLAPGNIDPNFALTWVTDLKDGVTAGNRIKNLEIQIEAHDDNPSQSSFHSTDLWGKSSSIGDNTLIDNAWGGLVDTLVKLSCPPPCGQLLSLAPGKASAEYYYPNSDKTEVIGEWGEVSGALEPEENPDQGGLDIGVELDGSSFYDPDPNEGTYSFDVTVSGALVYESSGGAGKVGDFNMDTTFHWYYEDA
jgi:hypothetical protein